MGSLFYCLLMFYEPIAKYYNPLTSLLTFLIPIIFVFRPKNIKELLRPFIVLNICAFFIGGVATALFFYSNANDYIGELIVFTVDNFSIKFLIFSCSFTYVSIKIARIIFLEKITQNKRVVDVKIKKDEMVAEFKALVDTGNTLREPTENGHIIIVEFDIIKKFLPDEMKLYFYEKEKSEEKLLYIIEEINNRSEKNIFNIVSFKSIGNEKGFLVCFKIDEAFIFDEKENLHKKDVFMGIADFNLSISDYQALINPEIFEEERALVWTK